MKLAHYHPTSPLSHGAPVRQCPSGRRGGTRPAESARPVAGGAGRGEVAEALAVGGPDPACAVAARQADDPRRRGTQVVDARRGELYLEVLGDALSARLLTFEETCSALGGLRGQLVLAGTAAKRMAEALDGADLAITVADIVAPDAVWVARLALGMEPGASPPRPLYLRAPDAKLPAKPA